MFMQSKFKLSDAATSTLLKFFIVLFKVLGGFSSIAASIVESLPSSLRAARLLDGETKFTRYVVCKKCHRIYFFKG